MPRSKRPKDVRMRKRAGGLVPMVVLVLVVLLDVMVVDSVVCCRFACVSCLCD